MRRRVAPEAPQTTAAMPAAKPQLGNFGFDMAGMDTAVAPGDDFYAFANGTWARTTAIPADKSNYGMFTALDDLSKERTRLILEEAKNGPPPARSAVPMPHISTKRRSRRAV